MKEMTYRDALRLGLQESMQSDPTIVILERRSGDMEVHMVLLKASFRNLVKTG